MITEMKIALNTFENQNNVIYRSSKSVDTIETKCSLKRKYNAIDRRRQAVYTGTMKKRTTRKLVVPEQLYALFNVSTHNDNMSLT